jgi:hypothetical protein
LLIEGVTFVDDGITILGPDALPEEWVARIKPELAPGERLIWAGQARPSRELSGQSYATIYVLGFAAVAVFGVAALFGVFGSHFRAIETTLATVGVGSGIISFLIGLGLIANMLDKRSERRLLKGTLYALTDARAITWSPTGGALTVQSIPRGSVKSLHRMEYADGSGSVIFDNPASVQSGVVSGFREIPDARRVEALVRLYLIGDDRAPSA